MKKTIVILCLFSSSILISQNCKELVVEVYDEIIKSIGNNFPYPPDLIFKNTTTDIAYFSSQGIIIENKIINHFCGDPNFKKKISYIIAHELAHHYLNHDWMSNSGLGYSSSIGEFIEEKSSSYEQKKLSETQADLFGGFFGQIAGLNTLSFGEEVIREVYDVYGLKKEIKGYPSLNERIQIINSKIDEVNNLAKIFEIGNVLLRLGEYELAKKCFQEILNKGFTSREIYNNLGLVYLLYGISIEDEKISKYQYPVYLDYQTRANLDKTRSVSLLDDPKKMLSEARKLFIQSKKLDQDYLPAEQNIYVLDFIENVDDKKARELILNKIKASNISSKNKVDFEIINGIINHEKKKKLEKKLENASSISLYNFSKEIKENKSIDLNWLIEKNIIDSSIVILGLERPFIKISVNRKLRITEKKIEEGFIYEINKSQYLIKMNQKILDNYDVETVNHTKYGENYYLITKTE